MKQIELCIYSHFRWISSHLKRLSFFRKTLWVDRKWSRMGDTVVHDSFFIFYPWALMVCRFKVRQVVWNWHLKQPPIQSGLEYSVENVQHLYPTREAILHPFLPTESKQWDRHKPCVPADIALQLDKQEKCESLCIQEVCCSQQPMGKAGEVGL